MLLQLLLTLALLGLTVSLSYDDIARDECLKKSYRCEDHRVSVTGGTGKYVTEPQKFRDICRRHKDFIACISDAEEYCSKERNITDFASMTLDNRISLKMFCKEQDWKKNYFSSVTCINQYNEANMEECRTEEQERLDVRPWWCLIPEPCEALERVFNCSVEKMKLKCGSIGAEVYRRMHLLKIEKLDVICAFRRRNPTYCATKSPYYDSTKQKARVPIKRSGPALPYVSDILGNAIIDVSRTIIDNLVNTVKEQDLISKAKLIRLINELSDFINEDKEKLAYSNENIDSLYHDIFNLPTEEDYQSTKEKQSSRNITSDKITYIKNIAQMLYNLLQSGKAEVVSVDDKYIELIWSGINGLPLESLVCQWHSEIFKCAVEYKQASSEHEVERSNSYEDSKTSDVLWENYNRESDSDFTEDVAYIESSIESSPDSDDIGEELDINENLVLSDIHKKGYQVLEVIDPSKVSKEIKQNGLEMEKNLESDELKDNVDYKSNYILVNEPYFVDHSHIYIPRKNRRSSTDKIADIVTDESSIVIRHFSNGEEKLVLPEESFDIPSEYFVNELNGDVQLTQIENIINERFQTVEITSNTDEYKEKRLDTNYSDKNCASKHTNEIREEIPEIPSQQHSVHAEL